MCAQKLSFDYAHTLHTVRIVHNAHSVHRSRVQKGKSCDCINFVRATDPPYNTGNDFVYEDDFAQSTDEYLTNSGQFDENGNRLVPNTESNGRFHMSLPTAMPKKSVERRFAEDLDNAEEVCVYAKLPRGFHIPTPVGNYSPDWAIAFYEGTVKHIYFIAETKGTMESLSLKPIEKAKISCARKLFNEISTENVKYHDVDNYQHLLDVMKSL